MEYIGFWIKNFKGIENIYLDLSNNPSGPVITLIGLNESGKTTILEAISYFEKNNNLKPLYSGDFIDDYNYDHLIPVKDKANFNDEVIVAARISLDDEDKRHITKLAKELNIKLEVEKLGNSFEIYRKFKYEDSEYTGAENTWSIELYGCIGNGRKVYDLYPKNKEKWINLVESISTKLPPILYFPTFLSEFPPRIFLNDDDSYYADLKNKYYKEIIQDILDSIDIGLKTEQHIVNRAIENSESQRRSLESVLNRMSNKVSQIVFSRWNEIFDNKIPRKDIVIKYGIEQDDEQKYVYLEFQIRDGDSIYLITERSLGFKWFFCFLLFTQFRSFRKHQKNTLFLLDEPASNLHSKAQIQLLKSFSKITENQGRIIFSTHSTYMINPKWLENTFIVKNEGLNYTDGQNQYEYTSRDTNIKIEKYRDFVGKNPDKETYFQPVLDVLDYVPNQLEFTDQAIFLEGKNDYYTIKYFSLCIQKSEKLSIFPGPGSGALDSLISLYLGWGKNFKILLDDDTAGRKERERYINEWLLSSDQVLTLSDINNKWEGWALDKLIDKKDLIKIQLDFYPNKSGRLKKKEVCRAIQELLLNERIDYFSKETTDSFSKLIDSMILLSCP